MSEMELGGESHDETREKPSDQSCWKMLRASLKGLLEQHTNTTSRQIELGDEITRIGEKQLEIDEKLRTLSEENQQIEQLRKELAEKQRLSCEDSTRMGEMLLLFNQQLTELEQKEAAKSTREVGVQSSWEVSSLLLSPLVVSRPPISILPEDTAPVSFSDENDIHSNQPLNDIDMNLETNHVEPIIPDLAATLNDNAQKSVEPEKENEKENKTDVTKPKANKKSDKLVITEETKALAEKLDLQLNETLDDSIQDTSATNGVDYEKALDSIIGDVDLSSEDDEPKRDEKKKSKSPKSIPDVLRSSSDDGEIAVTVKNEPAANSKKEGLDDSDIIKMAAIKYGEAIRQLQVNVIRLDRGLINTNSIKMSQFKKFTKMDETDRMIRSLMNISSLLKGSVKKESQQPPNTRSKSRRQLDYSDDMSNASSSAMSSEEDEVDEINNKRRVDIDNAASSIYEDRLDMLINDDSSLTDEEESTLSTSDLENEKTRKAKKKEEDEAKKKSATGEDSARKRGAQIYPGLTLGGLLDDDDDEESNQAKREKKSEEKKDDQEENESDRTLTNVNVNAADNVIDSNDDDDDDDESKSPKMSDDGDDDFVVKKRSSRKNRLSSEETDEDFVDMNVPRTSKSDENTAEESSEERKSESDSKPGSSEASSPGKGRGGKIENKDKRKRVNVKDSEDENNDDGDKAAKNKKKSKIKRKISGYPSSSDLDDVPIDLIAAETVDSDAEDDEENDDDEKSSPKTRRKIRKIISEENLAKETKEALEEEERRKKRIEEKRKLETSLMQQSFELTDTNKEPLYLDLDVKTKEGILQVDPAISSFLKPHQVEGIKFIFDSVFENVEMIKKGEKGSGCILAHCMGLGKTLQIVALVHTLITNRDITKIGRVLILMPVNVITNWLNEFDMWTKKCRQKVITYTLPMVRNGSLDLVRSRVNTLERWFEKGGVILLGYNNFTKLSQGQGVKPKKFVNNMRKCLLSPGPDLVICDEGHMLKSDKTSLNKSVIQIETKRRVVLTGTPLQNNLEEYHCMVSFVKPSLLGNKKEFMNRFGNPIKNGQHKDSTEADVSVMKKRAHVLHKTLEKCVQRKDYIVIKDQLPAKREYVLSVRLSPKQIELYRLYLRHRGLEDGFTASNRLTGMQIFADFHELMRIWTHPWAIKLNEERVVRNERRAAERDFIDDRDEDEIESGSETAEVKSEPSVPSPSSAETVEDDGDDDDVLEIQMPAKQKRKRRADSTAAENNGENVEPGQRERWWTKYIDENLLFDIEMSGKLVILNHILKHCQTMGDKLLIFSQSVLSLDLIEKFLNYLTQTTSVRWTKDVDYYRMDGTTDIHKRKKHVDAFNSENNKRSRLFLISTKAGGIGINLIGANRCVIFDASWNPSWDVQSIFRIYRFGQKKEVFVYRFLAQGTMEEKIYQRQVTKQSLSQRVIDEHQLDRHFTSQELTQLYAFEPDTDTEVVHNIPNDTLLKSLLVDCKQWIFKYHEHDSLLENKLEEGLSEDDRRLAWAEFEAERNRRPPLPMHFNSSVDLSHFNGSDFNQQFAFQHNLHASSSDVNFPIDASDMVAGFNNNRLSASDMARLAHSALLRQQSDAAAVAAAAANASPVDFEYNEWLQKRQREQQQLQQIVKQYNQQQQMQQQADRARQLARQAPQQQPQSQPQRQIPHNLTAQQLHHVKQILQQQQQPLRPQQQQRPQQNPGESRDLALLRHAEQPNSQTQQSQRQKLQQILQQQQQKQQQILQQQQHQRQQQQQQNPGENNRDLMLWETAAPAPSQQIQQTQADSNQTLNRQRPPPLQLLRTALQPSSSPANKSSNPSLAGTIASASSTPSPPLLSLTPQTLANSSPQFNLQSNQSASGLLASHRKQVMGQTYGNRQPIPAKTSTPQNNNESL